MKYFYFILILIYFFKKSTYLDLPNPNWIGSIYIYQLDQESI